MDELIERIEEATEVYRTRLATLPDPGDEGKPNRRSELEAEQRRLRAVVNELHRGSNSLLNIRRRLEPLIAWRDQLAAAKDRLKAKLATAEERLDEAKRTRAAPKDWRLEEIEVEALRAALDAAENGWTSEASQWMRGPCVPDRLQAELPGIDWDKAKPMTATERLIEDSQEQVDGITQRIRPHLVEAGVLEVDTAAALSAGG